MMQIKFVIKIITNDKNNVKERRKAKRKERTNI